MDAFEWGKLLKCDLKGKTCRKSANGQNIYVYEKQIVSRGLSAHVQMTIIFKQLFLRNCLANQSQTVCGSLLGTGNESLYKRLRSHDQDGRHGYK